MTNKEKNIGYWRRFCALFLLLFMVSVTVFGFSFMNTNNDDVSAGTKVKMFDIDYYTLKSGPKCTHSANNFSFVTAVGHDTYTSYIFICNSCFHHIEISPKGTALSPWTE